MQNYRGQGRPVLSAAELATLVKSSSRSESASSSKFKYQHGPVEPYRPTRIDEHLSPYRNIGNYHNDKFKKTDIFETDRE